MLNGKDTIVRFIAAQIKKTQYKGLFFSELKSSGRRVKVELNLSNYGTKADLKIATSTVRQNLLKNDLVNLKSDVDNVPKKCTK